ncbi:MAG TPA: lysophospholipid acyltransferase family protein [Chthoniobacterales bacterium]|nr:lysophospholipid acyltransferase family protein [Chthoniobacterales bacterium]
MNQHGGRSAARMSLRYRLVRKLGFLLRLRLEAQPGVAWRAAMAVLAGLMKLHGRTLRFRMHDKIGYLADRIREPVVFVVWHNRVFGLPHAYQRYYKRNRKAYVLTSAGPEGSLLALLVAHFGLGAVRGSTSRRASVAVREMEARIVQGNDVIVTPDGPRGQRYRMQPGALFVAQRTGRPLVPVLIEYSRYVRLKTWDGFTLPLPFSRVEAVLDEPLYLTREMTEEEFEATRRRLEQIMTSSMLMDAARGAH